MRRKKQLFKTKKHPFNIELWDDAFSPHAKYSDLEVVES
jgi:hypothetical protein